MILLLEQRLAQALTGLMIQGQARSVQKLRLGMLVLASLGHSQDFVEQDAHLSWLAYCWSGTDYIAVRAMLNC